MVLALLLVFGSWFSFGNMRIRAARRKIGGWGPVASGRAIRY
jgi:hypothetical protein